MPPGRDRKQTRWAAARAVAARHGLLVSAILIGATSIAFAAQQQLSGKSEAIFFAELGLLLLVGRALGELMQRFGQPAVMGQLLGGLLLGPSVLGLIAPDLQHMLFPQTAEQKSMVAAVSQLGILLLLLLTGMETDLRLVRRVGRSAITVAAAGVTLPFICGFALGEMLPDSILPNANARLVTALFLATALSISSIKIVAVVVREMNFMRRDIGQIIVASAILEDTSGWIIIAISFGIASSGTVDVRSVSFAVIGTLLFLAISLTVGRRVVSALIRWANDNFASEFPVITVILLIMIAHGADHLCARRADRARRFRRRHPDRRIADPHPAYRRTVARLDCRAVHAGVLRPVGPERRPDHPERPASVVARGRAHRHRQLREILRRFRRRQAWRAHRPRIAGARPRR